MTTVSDNMRDKAAQDLRQAMAATNHIIQLMEELTTNARMTTSELRHVAETLLDMWESNGIYGALTEYIETLAG